ncbi:MAG: hypothetical protein LBK23_03625 [Oscillospiraceae bacterium]|nr:hypothetical protein [Oscillospiraceae bacterium]
MSDKAPQCVKCGTPIAAAPSYNRIKIINGLPSV